MENTTLVYVIIASIIGIFIGFTICYITFRNSDKGRLEDELTRTKRELANQKRMLLDFFSSANALFEQLESSYSAYAHHMNEQSRKILPQLGNMFEASKHPINKATYVKAKPAVAEEVKVTAVKTKENTTEIKPQEQPAETTNVANSEEQK